MTHIRPATKEDLIEVARIFSEAISNAEWLPEPARAFTNFKDASEGEQVFVFCDKEERVKGFVSVQTEDSYIHHLFVDPAFYHQGIGSALLASLEGRLRLPWRLKCVDANVNALLFYKALGWQIAGSGGGDHGDYTVLEYRGKHKYE